MTPHRPPYKALKRTIMRLHLQSAREAQAAVIRDSSRFQHAFDAAMQPVKGRAVTAADYDRLSADMWWPPTSIATVCELSADIEGQATALALCGCACAACVRMARGTSAALPQAALRLMNGGE